MQTVRRRPRPALALPPTFGVLDRDALRDSYVQGSVLAMLAKRHAVRYWTFRGSVSTVELAGRRYAKSLAPFVDHIEEGQFQELIRETTELGVPRPTGYADVFHKHFHTPPVKWTHNAILSPRFVGGWQEAIRPGSFPQRMYRYDIRSAYLWAGSLGLPDPDSFRYGARLSPGISGVYRLTLERPTPGLPYPFNKSTDVIASTEEIEAYNLPIAKVLGGVVYSGLDDPGAILRTVRLISAWKQAGRMYWGRWAQTTPVRCHTSGRQWNLPSLNANIVWAHLIVSRVKLKVWNTAPRAVHVYVDSAIVPEPIRTGPAIGDWKLERTYDNGVAIRAAGWYGPRGEALEKMTGVPLGSRQRLADAYAEKYTLDVA